MGNVLAENSIFPHCIVALEGFEHVPDYGEAFSSCHTALLPKGILMFSIPWITPIHDRPHDYFRLTPAAIRLKLNHFREVKIIARGNFYDSIIALLLRGLFIPNFTGKALMLIGMVLSVLSPLPKNYKEIENIDSCLGYFTTVEK